MYLISACLVGVNCKYNGTTNLDEDLLRLFMEGQAIAICPEVLGNLSIPRDPCEIIKADDGSIKVVTTSGKDVTSNFTAGARKTLDICKSAEIDKAILQSRSPSCGYGRIYDGTFSGKLIEGNGLTAQLLSEHGIKIYTDTNWKDTEND